MRLISRLQRLENQYHTRECPLCKGNRPLVISYVTDSEPDPVPEGCPSCGRCTHIVVCYANEGAVPGEQSRVPSKSKLTGQQMADLYSRYEGR